MAYSDKKASADAFLYLLGFVGFENLGDRRGKTGNPLNRGGNDDLVGFSVCGTLKRFQTLDGQDSLRRIGFVDLLNTLCGCFLHLEDRLRFTLCFKTSGTKGFLI